MSNNNLYTAPNGVTYYFGTSSSKYPLCQLSECPIELSIYGYRCSMPMSITMIALYGILIILHAGVGWRYRTYGFTGAVLLGCISEVLGYVGRIILWYHPWNYSAFVLQIITITIGPVFFCAPIYILIAQICRYIDLNLCRVDPKWFYWIFIPCDIISLILQAAGGAISSTSDGSNQAGVDISIVGLSFQVATIFVFVTVCVDYAIRSRKVWKEFKLSIHFRIFITFLSLATLFIWMRCCYRIYELCGGYSSTSKALRDQPLFIALESAVVVAAAYCLAVAHPGPVFKSGPPGPAARQKKLAEKKSHPLLHAPFEN